MSRGDEKTPRKIRKTIINHAKLCCLPVCLGVDSVCAVEVQQTRTVDAPAPVSQPSLWEGALPADCPMGKSPLATGVQFTGRRRAYTGADTWYPSWAADGKLYSPFADGNVNDVGVMWNNHLTGNAVITGDDPLQLEVRVIGTYRVDPAPHGGVYPCGSLFKDGVWYYGYYALDDLKGNNWTVQGPLVGLRISSDLGKTWVATHTPAKPLFDEPRGEVRLGSPHFVDFGSNMVHSPDGKAYLVSHGTSRKPETGWRGQNWITGDQIFLSRVTPTPETINDPAAWEFFAGNDAAGQPKWTGRLSESRPVVDWIHNCGCVTVTWILGLKRYVMCTTNGRETLSNYDTWFAEAEQLTGPWRVIAYLRDFGTQAYFVNIPSKFLAADGRSFWLCYSANFAGGRPNPPGSGYAMCLQEARWTSGASESGSVSNRNPLFAAENVARLGKVTASSTFQGYRPEAAVDGKVDGWPNDQAAEWASKGEAAGAWLQIEWEQAIETDRIWLFDRPNTYDRIEGGKLVFDDESEVIVGELPDDANQGLEVRFKPRRVRSVRFVVTKVRPGCMNIGLSEMAVFTPETTARVKGKN